MRVRASFPSSTASSVESNERESRGEGESNSNKKRIFIGHGQDFQSPSSQIIRRYDCRHLIPSFLVVDIT